MGQVISQQSWIRSMSEDAISKVTTLENQLKEMDQLQITTWHTLHGGIYTRTILIEKDTAITGALVNVPTTLVVNGDVVVYANDSVQRYTGYNVIPASAHRKQAFVAMEDTMLTMSFSTNASTIGQAEDEFTNQSAELLSRSEHAVNHIIVTGE